MPALKALRIHEPMLIGEVSLMVRSMLTNRSGRPRSFTSATAPSDTATKAESRVLRRKRRPPGELRPGRQQTGSARDSAQEQVRRNLMSPRRGLDHRTAVVRAEFDFGDHRHLARTVCTTRTARGLAFPAPPAAHRLRRSQTVELRRAHRFRQNATAAAANMPAAAMPARLNICIRSAVHTLGSGGRP